MTEYVWDKGRAHMKARAGKWRQPQDGRIWDKGRAYVGIGKNRVVKGMTNIWGQQARRRICIERRQTPGKIHMRAGAEQVWVEDLQEMNT